jgi:hypothetical protein
MQAGELERRAAAARKQIEAISELSHRVGRDFTILSAAIKYCNERGLLSGEQHTHYTELNARANKAKHAGLGPAGAHDNLFAAPVMPTEEDVMRILRERHGVLRLREVYLLSLALDPTTTQMGSGVKTLFKQKLSKLEEAGHINKCGKFWSVL